MKAEVSFVDANDETVEGALYFQFEDGWILFKDEQGKAVVAYPEKRVTRIKRIEPTQADKHDVVVNLNNPLSAKEAMKLAGVL